MRIEIRAVSASFKGSTGAVVALDNVDMGLNDGEFVTIVGPSGCGKTTLLMIVAGLVTPSAGSVLIDGHPVLGPGPDRGVIFQQYALFPWMTVQDNVEFGLRVRGMGRREREEIARHYLKLVGLQDWARSLPKELSGGMKQRCAVARAYAVNPSILLMDEPFGALDAMVRADLQAQLLSVWEAERKTVLFVTHDVDEAVFLGSRVVVMSPGPGRLAAEFAIDLPYPRTQETRLANRFMQLRNEVWRTVRGGDAAATVPVAP